MQPKKPHIDTMIYAELRRLAAYYFRNERTGHTLQPTALVNEVFIKLSEGKPVQLHDRAHFFAVAARQMRQILIDHARRRNALKRNDTRIAVPLESTREENLLVVDEALKDLAELDPRAAQVVELRVFGGLKESEIAETLGISVATVKRDWTFARAWLTSRLRS
ncbi:MAG: sigma-70 family RNA polymerase sigma factor [Acidobacteria bacterium]|nr:sigma-70 family RNA polymerase sigma factor [Acidobacteriota bacterium]